jgi:hypothetical protein
MLFASAIGLRGETALESFFILTQKQFCVNANKKGKGLTLAFGINIAIKKPDYAKKRPEPYSFGGTRIRVPTTSKPTCSFLHSWL